MFTHMHLKKSVQHVARGATYQLVVYQVAESREYRIYVSKDGFGVGDIFCASAEVVGDAKQQGDDIVDGLVETAKDDINRNEYGMY